MHCLPAAHDRQHEGRRGMYAGRQASRRSRSPTRCSDRRVPSCSTRPRTACTRIKAVVLADARQVLREENGAHCRGARSRTCALEASEKPDVLPANGDAAGPFEPGPACGADEVAATRQRAAGRDAGAESAADPALEVDFPFDVLGARRQDDRVLRCCSSCRMRCRAGRWRSIIIKTLVAETLRVFEHPTKFVGALLTTMRRRRRLRGRSRLDIATTATCGASRAVAESGAHRRDA